MYDSENTTILRLCYSSNGNLNKQINIVFVLLSNPVDA